MILELICHFILLFETALLRPENDCWEYLKCQFVVLELVDLWFSVHWHLMCFSVSNFHPNMFFLFEYRSHIFCVGGVHIYNIIYMRMCMFDWQKASAQNRSIHIVSIVFDNFYDCLLNNCLTLRSTLSLKYIFRIRPVRWAMANVFKIRTNKFFLFYNFRIEWVVQWSSGWRCVWREYQYMHHFLYAPHWFLIVPHKT